MSSRDKKQREKTPYFRKLANRAREAAGLGRVLLTEPRSFPNSLLTVLKQPISDWLFQDEISATLDDVPVGKVGRTGEK
jgi:hypothetical protein